MFLALVQTCFEWSSQPPLSFNRELLYIMKTFVSCLAIFLSNCLLIAQLLHLVFWDSEHKTQKGNFCKGNKNIFDKIAAAGQETGVVLNTCWLPTENLGSGGDAIVRLIKW